VPRSECCVHLNGRTDGSTRDPVTLIYCTHTKLYDAAQFNINHSKIYLKKKIVGNEFYI